MANDAWRVGILGAGYIADWHCDALRRISGVRLAAVCDQNPNRAVQLAQRFSVPAHYTDLDDMLAGTPLDSIHVLLPPEYHFAAAKRILEAGVNVLLEKPMALREEECRCLGDLAARQGRAVGVGHNFLFAPIYEQLKADVMQGLLGRLRHVTITWNKELSQLRAGPFGGWMFRGPGNIMLEVGPHSVAHMLDLVGTPDRLTVETGLPFDLPNGVQFRRRWLVRAYKGNTCIDLCSCYAGGVSEHTIHVHGTGGSATADFERNTYVLRRRGARPLDFDRYDWTVSEGRSLVRQARLNLARYILSKFRLSRRGNSFGTSIARCLECFYQSVPTPTDRRLSAALGGEVVAVCGQIAQAACLEIANGKSPRRQQRLPMSPPTVLVLGGTGFIGRTTVRRLVDEGYSVRLLVRDPANLPRVLQDLPLDVVGGDIGNPADMDRALTGIVDVMHLARSNVKTWQDYQGLEICATRTVAEACLRRGVRRFIYTGTIDCFHSGDPSYVITDDTRLDPNIEQRNLYARAKAESERLLLEMHRTQKLPLVIFRPGVVLGRGGGPFHWGVGCWPTDNVCRLWGAGTHPLPLVLVDDVADALVDSLKVDGILGEAFNLVGEPSLSAREYVAELQKAAGVKIEVRPKPAWRYYVGDMFKWVVKVLVRHPGRRLPSYRDWQTRSHQSRFDCSGAKQKLGWQPTSDRAKMIAEGIVQPVHEWLA